MQFLPKEALKNKIKTMRDIDNVILLIYKMSVDAKKEKIQNIQFDFPFDQQHKDDFIRKFYETDDAEKKLKLVYFLNKNNKGPDYPSINYTYDEMLTWMTIWYELTGDRFAGERTNVLVTEIMYGILSGSANVVNTGKFAYINDLSPSFPLLVSSFLLAETGRNPASFLSTLVLFDLVKKYNEDCIGEPRPSFLARTFANKFSWKNVCWSSDGTESGVHPMAHDGSFADEFKDDCWNLKVPLTETRQKESDLLIRWLEFRFNLDAKEEINKILHTEVSQEEKKSKITHLIKEAFKQRICSFKFMLNPSVIPVLAQAQQDNEKHAEKDQKNQDVTLSAKMVDTSTPTPFWKNRNVLLGAGVVTATVVVGTIKKTSCSIM